MDLIRDLGYLALATRLKRLGERLQEEVSTVYAEQGLVGIHARWFPILRGLTRRSPQGISELAQVLGLTHTAVAQVAAPMERRGLIVSRPDPGDGRRRLLRLTTRGEAAVARLSPMWREIEAATRELVGESGHDLLAAVASAEGRLDARSMGERLRSRLERRLDFEIVPFAPALAPAFRALNLAWLEPRFEVEPTERRVLDDPKKEVIARGGEILFALTAGEPVGTCALIDHGGGVAEIAKMAVAEPVRGRGVGRALSQWALELAREKGAGTVFLLTSPELLAALALYRSLGFRPIETAPVPHRGYQRPSVVLQLDLADGSR